MGRWSESRPIKPSEAKEQTPAEEGEWEERDGEDSKARS